MLNYKTLALSVGLFVLCALPAFAASTDLTITGNGDSSHNEIMVVEVNVNAVVQTNVTDVLNLVKAGASTGGNQISGTTGGEASLQSGDASTTAKVTNLAGTNLSSDPCGCPAPAEPTVKIKGNGTKTNNKVALASVNMNLTKQTNLTDFHNLVMANSDSGKNKVKGTTGAGSTLISGAATTSVTVKNKAGINMNGTPAL